MCIRDRQNAKSQAAAGTEDDPEVFWKSVSSSSRTQWIRAWYAEKSGDMVVKRIDFSACRTCGGTGAIELGFTGDARTGGSGASASLAACPTCRTVGVVRRVKYR